MIYFFINESLKQFDSFLLYLIDYLNDNNINYRIFIRSNNDISLSNKISRFSTLEGRNISGINKILYLIVNIYNIKKYVKYYSELEKPYFIFFRDNPLYSLFFLSAIQKCIPSIVCGFQLTFPFYKSKNILNILLKRLFIKELNKSDYIFPISEVMKKELINNGINKRFMILPMGVDERAVIRRNNDNVPFDTESRVLIYGGSLRNVEEFFRILQRILDKSHEKVIIKIIARETSDTNRLINLRFQELVNTLSACKYKRLIYKRNLSIEETWKEISSSDIGISYIPENKLYWESSPTKTYEYLLMGKPTVVSNTVEEHCVQFQNTCYAKISSNDIEEFSNNILYYINKTNTELKDIGIIGQKWVLKHRSYKALMQKIFNIIHQKRV